MAEILLEVDVPVVDQEGVQNVIGSQVLASSQCDNLGGVLRVPISKATLRDPNVAGPSEGRYITQTRNQPMTTPSTTLPSDTLSQDNSVTADFASWSPNMSPKSPLFSGYSQSLLSPKSKKSQNLSGIFEEESLPMPASSSVAPAPAAYCTATSVGQGSSSVQDHLYTGESIPPKKTKKDGKSSDPKGNVIINYCSGCVRL